MTGDIIDFRVQPPFESFGSIFFFRDREVNPDPVTISPFAVGRRSAPSFDQFSMELFTTEMDHSGIKHAVIMGQHAAPEYGSVNNADIAKLVSDDQERFTGFAGIDANAPGAMEELESAIALGCRGISLVTGWSRKAYHEDAPVLEPILAVCAARGLPVMFTSSHYIGPDLSWAEPHYIQRVALAHPDLTVIVGHGNWPWTTAACALAMRCPNVYLMPEFYMYMPGMPGARDYIDAANGFLAHRFLYSSCYPTLSLEQALENFSALPISPKSRKLMLYENAARVLSL
ncbi:hypothetical protein FB472_1391 [Rhodoglobus vestalii]|uniref:Amidohydrolase-related domain-containing protein n=1 Tax=Rhodoglobus vestalii TaxID=193384 RepID=A0A8H2K8V0_9MICO|nr:amidohydrolase family protein [Rhodoglobus vestalii]TQO19811.1 hypothetical protein FB472_1391 [Rhodoglobus vestalii]